MSSGKAALKLRMLGKVKTKQISNKSAPRNTVAPVSKTTERGADSTFHTHLRNAGNKQWPGAFIAPAQSSGNVRTYYSTGLPPLDLILSGEIGRGMCGGKIVEVFGDYDVGKTTLGVRVCKAVQDAGGVVVIFDTESTLSTDRMSALGLDVERVTIIETQHIETIFDQIEFLVKALQDRPAIIFVDTMSSVKSRADEGKKTGEGQIARIAKMVTEGLRGIAKPLAKGNTLLLCNGQMKQGAIGKWFAAERERNVTVGGKALKFHAIQSVRIDGYKPERVKAKGSRLGFVVTVSTVKSKLTASGLTCTLAFDTSADIATFDDARSVFKTLAKWGKVTTTGKVTIDKTAYIELRFTKKYNTDEQFKQQTHELLSTAFTQIKEQT